LPVKNLTSIKLEQDPIHGGYFAAIYFGSLAVLSIPSLVGYQLIYKKKYLKKNIKNNKK